MSAYKRLLLLVGFTSIVLTVAVPTSAQTAMATARGTIKDEQGGLLPGVTVTVRHTQTDTSRTVVTGPEGRYVIPNLSPGTYEITAEVTGFTTSKRIAVLQVRQEATVDFELKLGGFEESVEVSSQAVRVETQHTVGAHLDTKALDDLPTLTRDFAGLAKLAPGISSTGTQGTGFAAGGARQFQNLIVVDGGANTQQFYGASGEFYPQDWVQEFEVMSGAPSAEFGQAQGAIVNVVTRSGTNDFTGRVYGFVRDQAFDSPGFAGTFDANGEPVFLDKAAPFDQERVGAFVGGPIVRNKLFYFLGAESLENDATRILPLAPYWRTHGGPGTGPVGHQNGPGGSGFDADIPTKNITRAFVVKTDWNLHSNHRLTLRHSRSIKRDQNCTGQGGEGCNSEPTAVLERSATFKGPLWSVLGNLTSTLSNSAFNELRLFYAQNKLYILGNKSGGLYGRALIDRNADGSLAQLGYPGVLMGQTRTSGLEGETSFYVTETFMLVKGKHQFKMGGNVYFPKFFMDFDGAHKGRWSFPEDRGFDLNDPRSFPDTFSGIRGYATWFQGVWNYNVYFQDTWQIRDNLTLNLGLRNDFENTMTVGNDLVDAYNARLTSRWGGSPVANKVDGDWNNLAPRLGVVWVPRKDRRTTIRGSAGRFYDQGHYNYNDFVLNRTLLTDRTVDFSANSANTNPFCVGGVVNNECRAALRAFLASYFPAFPPLQSGPLLQERFNGFESNVGLPSSTSFSGGFTHSLSSDFSVQADYVHNRSNDVLVLIDRNIVSIQGTRVTTRDPRFTEMYLFTHAGWFRYHGLLTRAEWRHGEARIGASYTLSKCRGNTRATTAVPTQVTNPLDLSVDVGPCSGDRRHILALDGSAMLPAQFQLAAIYQFGSAVPYTVTTRFRPFELPEGRNSRRGDDERNVDLRVTKHFRLGRGVRIAAFWEMFNALNVRNFTSFQGSLEAFDFGKPRNILAMRRQQLGLRIDF